MFSFRRKPSKTIDHLEKKTREREIKFYYRITGCEGTDRTEPHQAMPNTEFLRKADTNYPDPHKPVILLVW